MAPAPKRAARKPPPPEPTDDSGLDTILGVDDEDTTTDTPPVENLPTAGKTEGHAEASLEDPDEERPPVVMVMGEDNVLRLADEDDDLEDDERYVFRDGAGARIVLASALTFTHQPGPLITRAAGQAIEALEADGRQPAPTDLVILALPAGRGLELLAVLRALGNVR